VFFGGRGVGRMGAGGDPAEDLKAQCFVGAAPLLGGERQRAPRGLLGVGAAPGERVGFGEIGEPRRIVRHLVDGFTVRGARLETRDGLRDAPGQCVGAAEDHGDNSDPVTHIVGTTDGECRLENPYGFDRVAQPEPDHPEHAAVRGFNGLAAPHLSDSHGRPGERQCLRELAATLECPRQPCAHGVRGEIGAAAIEGQRTPSPAEGRDAAVAVLQVEQPPNAARGGLASMAPMVSLAPASPSTLRFLEPV